MMNQANKTRVFFSPGSQHANGDGDELHVPVVAVPLHAFQRLEVRLVETHVRILHALGRVQAGDGLRILDQNGLLSLNARRTGRKHPALPMVPEHAPETASPRSAPATRDGI